MAKAIIPRVVRDRLHFEVGPVLLPSLAQAASAWSATETHRLDIAEEQPPLRHCQDCQLDLCRDVLRALGSCPRWGMARDGIESRCAAFVPKSAEVANHG